MGGSACEEGREGSRGRTGALHGKVNTIDDFTIKNASYKVLTNLSYLRSTELMKD